jgi:cytidyltransferase-like protein
MSRIVLVTGGFDPLHSGHIAYFKAAKELGDKLVVGLNSDNWLKKKKGKPFMPFSERCAVVKELYCVDRVIGFDDTDGTAGQAIFYLQSTTGNKDTIIFANGGDRTEGAVPEEKTYSDYKNVEFAYGVGGEDKKNSSSWILEEWKAPKTIRNWGYYRNLYKGKGFMVKELVINPHSSLSMQKHQHRSETWNLVSGQATLKVNWGVGNQDPFDGCSVWELHKNNPVDVGAKWWHQGCNNSDEPAHIIEIWKGDSDKLSEEDIERWDKK